MAKTKKRTSKVSEPDSTYFLKLVLYLILGSFWIRLENMPSWSIGLPIGLFVGLAFATHEKFQIDRKIEYALLLISTFVGFWLPIGLVIEV